MGGIDQNNEVLNDCWFYNGTKQIFEKVDLDLDWNELRGAKAIGIHKKKVYLLSGATSSKYKAI